MPKNMKDCTVCGNPRSAYILNNKTVCLKCDELLFDLEIETDEAPMATTTKREQPVLRKPSTPTIKKA